MYLSLLAATVVLAVAGTILEWPGVGGLMLGAFQIGMAAGAVAYRIDEDRRREEDTP
jgi:hypothetical protein